MRGVYCLVIRLSKSINPIIGALGKIRFSRGCYVYVGSAQNSVEKRVARHMKKIKKEHWHIDYLLSSRYAVVEKVMYKEACKDEECKISDFLGSVGEGIKGFGCSDCSCRSHLFKMKPGFKISGMRKL